MSMTKSRNKTSAPNLSREHWSAISMVERIAIFGPLCFIKNPRTYSMQICREAIITPIGFPLSQTKILIMYKKHATAMSPNFCGKNKTNTAITIVKKLITTVFSRLMLIAPSKKISPLTKVKTLTTIKMKMAIAEKILSPRIVFLLYKKFFIIPFYIQLNDFATSFLKENCQAKCKAGNILPSKNLHFLKYLYYLNITYVILHTS